MRKSFFLISTVLVYNIAHAKISTDQCGLGFDCIEGVIKKSPFSKYKCITENTNQKAHFLFKKINSLQEIFDSIQIPYNKQFFHSKLVREILYDYHINQYTLTYLVYQDETIFETHLLEKESQLSRQNANYIMKIKTGGKHIVLYHIQCDSKLDYQKEVKKLNKIKNWNTFKKELFNINKIHNIIVKNFYNDELSLIPANDLNKSFNQIDKFKNTLKQHATPYAYTNKEKCKNTNSTISKILDMQFFTNNARYYRQHYEIFKPLDKDLTKLLYQNYKKFLTMINKITNNPAKFFDSNLSTYNNKFNALLPIQYNSSVKHNDIVIPDQNVTVLFDSHTEKNLKIDSKLHFHITLVSKLDIKNHGQLLRLQNTIIFNDGRHSHKENQIKILYDTYVNYPGLKFFSISSDYGSLTIDTTFNKYELYNDTQGTGILKEATCGYEIKSKGKIKVVCKNIKYNAIKINFKHIEEE